MHMSLLDFYKGVDISFLPQYLDEGMQIRDFDGTPVEPFTLLKKYGVNAIRLRIWNKPENVPESKGYCNLAQTIEMARQVKNHGMRFLLDFHYSDYWADPAQQKKPKDWESLSFEELKIAVYSYTRDTLLALDAEGVLPDMVQIGNEIRSGFLFPDGELPDYEHMVELINAGIRGARSVGDSDRLQIMIHLDQGGRYFYLKEWFSKAFACGLLDFDLIGLSYYPFWHGTFTDLKDSISKLSEEFQKPILIVETAHAWRKSANGFIDETQEKIAGVEATPQGQRKVLDLVMNIVASLPDHRGLGIYYWEPLCIPLPGQGGWAENMGLLDEQGKVMEGIRSFEFTRQKERWNEYAKIYAPRLPDLLVGMKPDLPKELPVLMYDGSIRKKKVTWLDALGQVLDFSETGLQNPGTYVISGVVEGSGEMIDVEINVLTELIQAENLLRDANWDEGLIRWEVEKGEEQVMVQICPEFEDPFPAPPVNGLRVESRKNFTFQIRQQINIVKAGKYDLQVEFRGTDTTNVEIRLFGEQGDQRKETVIHPSEHGWTLYEVKDLMCSPGILTVGISIASPPIYGLMRRFNLINRMDR